MQNLPFTNQIRDLSSNTLLSVLLANTSNLANSSVQYVTAANSSNLNVNTTGANVTIDLKVGPGAGATGPTGATGATGVTGATGAAANANNVTVYANGSLILANSNLNFNNTYSINVSATANGTNQTNISFSVNPAIIQSGIPFIYPASGFVGANGAIVIGQNPANSATLTLGGTSGNVSAAFSANTLLGTSNDVGRIITVYDGTGYRSLSIITAGNANFATVNVVANTGVPTTTGPYATANIWLTAGLSGNISNSTYSSQLPFGTATSVNPPPYAGYTYMPANTITANNTAGWYWGVWTCNTVGTLYSNTYTNANPVYISSPGAFNSTGNGAYTQPTGTNVNGPQSVLIGNTLGVNGRIENEIICSSTGNTTKILRPFMGVTSYGYLVLNGYNFYTSGGFVSITNRGVSNNQIWTNGNASYGGDFFNGNYTNGAVRSTNVDTTQNQNMGLVLYVQGSFDCLILESYSVKIFPHS